MIELQFFSFTIQWNSRVIQQRSFSLQSPSFVNKLENLYATSMYISRPGLYLHTYIHPRILRFNFRSFITRGHRSDKNRDLFSTGAYARLYVRFRTYRTTPSRKQKNPIHTRETAAVHCLLLKVDIRFQGRR